jgi:isocitrate/isopropylmalate dehydrogenase
MNRLIILTIQRCLNFVIVRETTKGVFINTHGNNSKFKAFCRRNLIDVEYTGGNNYKLIIN